MTAPDKHTVVLEPPYPGIQNNPKDLYKHLFEYWQRTGSYKSAITNLRGLTASVRELNTLTGIRTDETVQGQLNLKANSADLGTMAIQNANNVNIDGGTITQTSISQSNISIPAGSSGLNVALGATLNQNTNYVGNTAGIETTLMTYTLIGNVLDQNGQYLEITAWGTFAANANNKRIKFKLNISELFDTGDVAANDGSWMINSTVVRSGKNQQESITNIISSNALINPTTTSIETPQDMGDTINIHCTGQAVATDDIIQKGLIIKWFNY